jgi:hypothetical protein
MNAGGRIGRFEEGNEEMWQSPHRLTSEPNSASLCLQELPALSILFSPSQHPVKLQITRPAFRGHAVLTVAVTVRRK